MMLRKMSARQPVAWLLAGVDPRKAWGSWEGKGVLKLEGIFLRGSDFISGFEELESSLGTYS